MTHKCIGIKPEVDDLNKAINKEEGTSENNKWWLEYYHSRLQERHDIEINNREHEIYNLKKRITELEKYEPKDIIPEKVNIKLTFNKTMKNGKCQLVTLSSDSKKYTPQYDEVGRKWFIPKLNDDSYIKINFTGKDGKKLNYRGEDDVTYIYGISESSAIIGNSTFGKGTLKDGFILNKRALNVLLINPMVFFYILKGTENIEIIESSKDINATLEVI